MLCRQEKKRPIAISQSLQWTSHLGADRVLAIDKRMGQNSANSTLWSFRIRLGTECTLRTSSIPNPA